MPGTLKRQFTYKYRTDAVKLVTEQDVTGSV